MLNEVRRVLAAHPVTVVREACGLAGLCVAIVAALFLPVLA